MIRGAAIAAVVAASACGRIGFGLIGDGGPAQPSGDAGIPSAASCTVPPLPDTSAPDHVIGDGTPTDCTEDSLRTAITAGGVTVLNCGSNATIALALGELVVSAPTTVLSGYGVTLDAGSASRVIHAIPGVQQLALLGLGITNGSTTTYGAGVYVESGALSVFDGAFSNNHGPISDTTSANGGGAIAAAVGVTVEIYRSTFSGNSSSNGGAIEVYNDLTIAQSTFVKNQATGSGGSMAGGGLGGAIVAAGIASDTFCGVTLADNTAGSQGGGILRVSIDGTGSDTWEQSSIVGNTATDSTGGMYVQDIGLALDRVVIAENSSNTVGGLFYVGAAGPFTATQIQIADNTATAGLGAGLELNGVPGSIAFSTISGNRASCPTCWAGGIDGGGAGMTVTSSVFDGNTAGDPNNAITCGAPLADGGGNFQWPVMRAGGGTDDPSALCTSGAMVVDPMIGALADRTGPAGGYLVASPVAGSPVIGAASHCPAVDLVGNPRPTPCAAGAVEP